MAIIGSLLIIANSDGEFHKKEAQFLKEVSKVLGYKSSRSKLNKFMSIGLDEMFLKLNGLDDSQKEWYIVTTFTMLHVDGQALDLEFQYLEVYFAKMGINREKFKDVIEKSHILLNDVVNS